MKNKKIMAFLRNAGIMAVLFAATQNAAAWGALATFSATSDSLGFPVEFGGGDIVDAESEAEARNAVLRLCRETFVPSLSDIMTDFSAIPGSCRVRIVFRNQCAAEALGAGRPSLNGGGSIYFASGNTAAVASQNALNMCEAGDASICQVTFGSASSPICDGTAGDGGDNTDTGEVEVFSLGGITRMAVRNGTRQEVVYEPGEWFEPENSDNQRMMVTERTVVRSGGLSDVPVACQQINKLTPTRNAQYSSARAAENDPVSQCQLRCLDGNNVQSCIWRCETRTDADEDFRTVETPTMDNFPAELTPQASPQEVGTDIPNVEVRGLGTTRQLAVRNTSDNFVTYRQGDYLEPKDGDFQRMIITETTRVAAGETASIPVACRQRDMDTPARGAAFYSMPSTIQTDSASLCQLDCLDETSSVQSCIWRCETQPESAVREFTTPSPSVDTMDSGSNPTTNTGGSSGGGGGSSNTGLIIGGVAVVGGLIWFLSSGGEEGEFNFSHDFGYFATESGYSANVGGQMDFRKDNWHLYFSGDGSIDGKFRYQSGGSYTADFWTAEFSESVSGKTADYDLSLSSDFGSGIWKLSPTYRLHSEYSDSEFDTQNSLNLESEFRYNNWQIRPTAGFNWREFGEFADSGTFRINAVHRF